MSGGVNIPPPAPPFSKLLKTQANTFLFMANIGLPFEVKRYLGCGVHGSVFLIDHEGEDTALKIAHPYDSTDIAYFVEKLEKEHFALFNVIMKIIEADNATNISKYLISLITYTI